MKDLYLEDDRFVESRFSFRPKRKKGKSKKAKKKKSKQFLTSDMSTNTLIGEENEAAKPTKDEPPKKVEVSRGFGLAVFFTLQTFAIYFIAAWLLFWTKINTGNFP